MVEEEVIAAGGVDLGGKRADLVLFPMEIRNNPEEAVEAANVLINQKGVQVLIGPQHSGDAIPVGELAEKAGVLMISPMSTNPKTTEGRTYVFRVGFLDDYQGAVLAAFAREELGVTRAAVLYDVARPYNRGIAERFASRFRDLGGEIVASETYVTGTEDFSGNLGRIREASPELLLLPNHNNDVLLQVPQARRAGVEAVLLGTDAWNEQLLASLPQIREAYKTTHWSGEIDTAGNRAFVRKYTGMFREEPNAVAALTYDAFQILFAAARQAGSVEPAALRDSLTALAPYAGLSGSIDYIDSGDPVKGAVILGFRDGEVAFLRFLQP